MTTGRYSGTTPRYGTGLTPIGTRCDHPGTTAFTIGKRRFGGASDRGAYIPSDKLPDLIVDLAGTDAFHPPSTFPAEIAQFFPARPAVLSVRWPDYGVRVFPPEFWQSLATLVPPDGKITFTCIGGHGRTGTALAACCITLAGMPAQEAIDFVRDVHCSQAIETDSQEDALFRLAGEDPPERKSSVRYQGGGYPQDKCENCDVVIYVGFSKRTKCIRCLEEDGTKRWCWGCEDTVDVGSKCACGKLFSSGVLK